MSQPDREKQERLNAAAQRALDEARERAKSTDGKELPTELGGRDGPEPTRFGDWEKDGIVSDF